MKSTAKTPNSNRGFNAQFLSIAPLSQPLITDRVVASIDNLRIKYTYKATFQDFGRNKRYDTIEYLLERLANIQDWLFYHYEAKVSESKYRIGNYAYTVHFEIENGSSFAVLLGRYSSPDKAVGYAYNKARCFVYDVVIDFNPNKVPSDVYTRVMALLRSLALSVSIQRFDLALDIPVPRSDLQLVERPGSKYQLLRDDGVQTEYIGLKNQHSRIKLYDKGFELGYPDLKISRLEFTVNSERFKTLKSMFPEVKMLAPVEPSEDFADLPFPVKAVIRHPDLYEELKASTSANTWRKYKPMIQAYGQTLYALSDDLFREIDDYVKQRLERFKTLGDFTPC